MWQISVRTAAILPHILPKLVQLPLRCVQLSCLMYMFSKYFFSTYILILTNVFSELNAHALGALAEVAGAGLNLHLSTVLPALLSAMGDDNVVSGISSNFFLSLPPIRVNFPL